MPPLSSYNLILFLVVVLRQVCVAPLQHPLDRTWVTLKKSDDGTYFESKFSLNYTKLEKVGSERVP